MESSIDVFAAYAAGARYEMLPEQVATDAKLKVLDSVACASAGRSHAPAQVALRLAGALPEGHVRVLGDKRRLTAPDAALVNGVLIHALLQDDVDLESGHPACTVIAAAIAIAEERGRSGKELVTAIVLGYEAMWRIGGRGKFLMAATARGFRGNTILGTFGSAAASAKLLGLDNNGIAAALRVAGSFAAGLLAPLNEGSMERCFQQGSNARQGLLAALLAANGIDGCQQILSGPTGFYAAFAGAEAPEDSMDGLGRIFRLREAFAKPYPSAGSNTVGLAVLDLLRHRGPIDGARVDRVRMQVLPRFTGVPGYPSIAFKGPFTSVEQALISYPFQVACLLLFGAVDFPTIQEHLEDPSVLALARRVTLEGVSVPHPLWCAADVVMSDGQTRSATSDEIDWSDFYLDAGATRRKLGRMFAPDRVDRLFELGHGLDELDRVDSLLSAAFD